LAICEPDRNSWNSPNISPKGLTDAQIGRKTVGMSIASTSRRLVGTAVAIIIIR
jgi:hypothetical protein